MNTHIYSFDLIRLYKFSIFQWRETDRIQKVEQDAET